MPRNLDEKFKLARNTLLQFIEQDTIKENTTKVDTAKKKSIEEDRKSREIVVSNGVSLEKFRELRIEARKFKIYIRLVEGEVIVYEMPTSAHAYAAGYLVYLIGSWSNYLDVAQELDVDVRRNTQYVADVVVEPMQPIQLGPQRLGQARVSKPRMIVEVGRYESIGSLHSLSGEYFSTSPQTSLIQVYLSIKIFSPREDNTAAMVVMLYLRNNQIPVRDRPNIHITTIQNTIPNLVISFGTAPISQESRDIIDSTGILNYRITGFLQPNDVPCTNLGMQNYQINIPSNLLFDGFPGGVPQGTPNNPTIDLYEVQQRILRRL